MTETHPSGRSSSRSKATNILLEARRHAVRLSASRGLYLIFLGLLCWGAAYIARFHQKIFFRSYFFPGYFGHGFILALILGGARARVRDRQGISLGLWSVGIQSKAYLDLTNKVSTWIFRCAFALAGIYLITEYLFGDLLYKGFLEPILISFTVGFWVWNIWWYLRTLLYEHVLGAGCAAATFAILIYFYWISIQTDFSSNLLWFSFDSIFGVFGAGCLASGLFLHLRWRRIVREVRSVPGWLW